MQQHCYKNYHLMVITKYFKLSESPLHQVNNHLHTSLVRIKQTYRGQSYRQTFRQTDSRRTYKQTDRCIDRQMMVGGYSDKQRNYLFLESFIYLTLHSIVSVTQSMYTSSHQVYEWLRLTWHDFHKKFKWKEQTMKITFFFFKQILRYFFTESKLKVINK